LPPEVHYFINYAVKKLLAKPATTKAGKPRHSLFVSQPPHRPSSGFKARNIEIWGDVERLKAHGQRLGGAFMEVAKKYSLTTNSIKKLYEKTRAELAASSLPKDFFKTSSM
jgi:hypothetical protein